MPGRLAIFDDAEFLSDINKLFPNFKNRVGVLNPKYNIAPTIAIPIFLDTTTYLYSHFGLIPSWSQDNKTFHINARSETLFEKKSFRDSFKSKRCIISINGYYEWIKDTQNESIPYIIQSKEKSYLALAGLWDEWYDASSASYILSCSIITTAPNEKIAKIHDRMPMILEQKDWNLWLDKSADLSQINKLFKSYDENKIVIKEVSTLVNSVANDSVQCLDKCNNPKKQQQLSLF